MVATLCWCWRWALPCEWQGERDAGGDGDGDDEGNAGGEYVCDADGVADCVRLLMTVMQLRVMLLAVSFDVAYDGEARARWDGWRCGVSIASSESSLARASPS